MVSKNQKAIYLLLAAGILWLRYAKSAEGARQKLRTAGDKITNTVITIQDRAQQLDAVVHDMIETLRQLEVTAATFQENVTESSHEITAMIKDIRAAVGRSVTDPSQAA
jgi:hypothetical protein